MKVIITLDLGAAERNDRLDSNTERAPVRIAQQLMGAMWSQFGAIPRDEFSSGELTTETPSAPYFPRRNVRPNPPEVIVDWLVLP